MTAVRKRRETDLDPTLRARELTRMRTVLGSSASGWAGDAAVVVEEGRWLISTSAASVDMNVALCHGTVGALQLGVTVQDILQTGKPAILMVAGEALANVQQLTKLGWVCVGSAPIMGYEFGETEYNDDVRMLTRAELPLARSFLEDRFELSADAARIALPDAMGDGDIESAAWGLFQQGELVATTVSVLVGDVTAIWWMAVRSSRLRRGFARRLLAGVFFHAQRAGTTKCVLHASPSGLPLYAAVGFEVLEIWQMWSRPRWVFGRD